MHTSEHSQLVLQLLFKFFSEAHFEIPAIRYTSQKIFDIILKVKECTIQKLQEMSFHSMHKLFYTIIYSQKQVSQKKFK